MKANAYGYGVPPYVPPPRKGILHSEAFQLLISWGAITVAFGAGSILSGDIIGVVLAGVAVGTGFIFHELAHRQVARYYGVYARYRAWYTGLLLAVTIAFLSAKMLGMPFVLAAPGAVYIVGAMGFIHPLLELRIAEAGPLANIVVSITFFVGSALTPNPWHYYLGYISSVNAWLAFFNLLPVPPLDGYKIMRIRTVEWGILLFAAFVLTFIL